jgi:hypothetical protein
MARRGTKKVTLQDRLAKWSEGTRQRAHQMPPGRERDALLKKATLVDPAKGVEWTASLALRALSNTSDAR